jgi:hypothetical protein
VSPCSIASQMVMATCWGGEPGRHFWRITLDGSTGESGLGVGWTGVEDPHFRAASFTCERSRCGFGRAVGGHAGEFVLRDHAADVHDDSRFGHSVESGLGDHDGDERVGEEKFFHCVEESSDIGPNATTPTALMTMSSLPAWVIAACIA